MEDLAVLTAAMQDVHCITLRALFRENAPPYSCAVYNLYHRMWQSCSGRTSESLGIDEPLIPHFLGSQNTITFWQSWLWPYLAFFVDPTSYAAT